MWKRTILRAQENKTEKMSIEYRPSVAISSDVVSCGLCVWNREAEDLVLFQNLPWVSKVTTDKSLHLSVLYGFA